MPTFFNTITDKEATTWLKVIAKSDDMEETASIVHLIDDCLTLQKGKSLLTRKKGLTTLLKNRIADECSLIMPTTQRKERIDIRALHKARVKLQAGQELDFESKKVLLDLIQDGERVIYPTQMQKDRYEYQLSMIEKFAPDQEDSIDTMLDGIIEYEQKFCGINR